MNTISTSVFDFLSPAPPEQVWAALTSGAVTSRYFFGMAVISEWEPGAPVVVTPPAGKLPLGSLQGEVLVADRERRLSYSLGSGEGQPTTYVTWLINPAEGRGGSHVRLYVDETDLPADVDEDEDGRRSWGQVVSALEDVLAGLPLA